MPLKKINGTVEGRLFLSKFGDPLRLAERVFLSEGLKKKKTDLHGSQVQGKETTPLPPCTY